MEPKRLIALVVELMMFNVVAAQDFNDTSVAVAIAVAVTLLVIAAGALVIVIVVVVHWCRQKRNKLIVLRPRYKFGKRKLIENENPTYYPSTEVPVKEKKKGARKTVTWSTDLIQSNSKARGSNVNDQPGDGMDPKKNLDSDPQVDAVLPVDTDQSVFPPVVGTVISKSGPEVKSEPEVKMEPEVKSEPEVKLEPEVESEPEVKLKAEIKLEPEIKSEPEIKLEPEIKSQPEVTSGEERKQQLDNIDADSVTEGIQQYLIEDVHHNDWPEPTLDKDQERMDQDVMTIGIDDRYNCSKMKGSVYIQFEDEKEEVEEEEEEDDDDDDDPVSFL